MTHAPDNRPAGALTDGADRHRPFIVVLVALALITLTTAGWAVLSHRTVTGTPSAVRGLPGQGAPLQGLSAAQSGLVRRLPAGTVDDRSCRPLAGSRAVLATVVCQLQSGPPEITLYATAYRSDAEMAADVKYETLGEEPSGPCGFGREHVQSIWTAGDGTASGSVHCGGLSEALPWHYIAMEYPTASGGPLQLFFQVSLPASVDPIGADHRSEELVNWWRAWIGHSGSLRR